MNWGQVLAWVEDDPDDAAEVGTMVRLVEARGVPALVAALRSCVSEKKADTTVSTAHKSKGREWPRVKIAGDFLHRTDMVTEELRLAYVAVTRARQELDLTAWLATPQRGDRARNGQPGTTPPPPPPPAIHLHHLKAPCPGKLLTTSAKSKAFWL